MRPRATLGLAWALGIAALVPPRAAHAQPGDPAVARALFEEATRELGKGDWEGACPKFEGSFASKPTVSALVSIGKCHDHAGKLTLAAEDFQRALTLNEDTVSQSRKKELAAYTGDLLSAITARIPKLRIAAKDPPPGLQITRDGAPLPPTAIGIPLPVDPGEHVIVATAPGRKASTVKVALTEKSEIEVAINLEEEVPPPAPATVETIAPAVPSPPTAAQPEVRRGAPAWAWATGAIGIAAAGVAIYFAVDGAGANCGGPCYDTQFTQAEVNALNARRHRDLAGGLALGAVGVVAVAVGAWGIAAAPRRTAPSALLLRPWLFAERPGLTLAGSF